MATKLKNSRKNRGIKILSLVLAVLTGGLALFSLAFCVATYAHLSTSDYTLGTLLDGYQRHRQGAFLTASSTVSRTQEHIQNVITYLEKYKNEDYYQNIYLPQEYSRLTEEREEYIQEQIDRYGLDYSFYPSYTEPETSYEETTVYNSPIEPATSVSAGASSYSENSRYQAAYDYWFKQFNLSQKYSSIQNDIENCLRRLESITNLQIYAVSRDDGTVYTNVNAENPVETIQSLPFAMGYCVSPQTQTVESYGEQTNTLLAERLKSIHYTTDTMDIYFGVDYRQLQGTDDYTELARSYEWYINIFDITYPLLLVMSPLFALFFLLSVCLAGRGPLPEEGTEEYRRKIERFGGTITGRTPVLRNGLDAIPNDLHLILGLGLSFGCAGYGLFWSFDQLNEYNFVGPILMMLLFSMAFAFFFMELSMSVSRNAKAGHYWRRTLLASSLRGIRRSMYWFKNQFSPLGHHFKSLPRYILRLLIAYFIVMVPLSFIPILPVLFNIFVVLFAWRSMASLDRLMKYAHEIQSGNLNVGIDLSRFPKWMLPFVHDIVHLRDGMREAVEDALKSERMKTELITNVSHDLKTPLTSIINYTDLLSKCDIQDAHAQEYIGVLQQKSDRLKRLIEDLVEASKASTGNIKFSPVRLNLYEMAVQAVGEHEDTLSNQGITVLINEPEKQPIVWADSQKTWRIIDNLFSNVRKYSAPGTRAYIDVSMDNGCGVFTIKNISRDELNIRPEELMERFVRGDESRSTEGSGLGLSIAQNLCEKQGGRFDISIDGDLFKATVRLPLAPGDPLPLPQHPASPTLPEEEKPESSL